MKRDLSRTYTLAIRSFGSVFVFLELQACRIVAFIVNDLSRLKMRGVGSLTGIYAPLGWQNINEFGLTYAIELAVWHGFQQTTFIWGALKLGWHFY
jgi:hypothetical protein